MQDFAIRVVAMATAISLLVWLYNLSPAGQPWVIFAALGGLAMSGSDSTVIQRKGQ